MWNRVAVALVVTCAVASSAAAQNQSAGAQTLDYRRRNEPASTSGTPSDEVHTRPATTTFMGDTGLWYVPTGEMLPAKRWSGSVYRVNFDDNQGFTDVSNWPVTFGVRAQGPGGDLRVVRAGQPD